MNAQRRIEVYTRGRATLTPHQRRRVVHKARGKERAAALALIAALVALGASCSGGGARSREARGPLVVTPTSSEPIGWNGYTGPTRTTTVPPTPPTTARVSRSRPPAPSRGSLGAGGGCDRPSTCPALRQCENGGSYGTHSNNGYTGAYQISGSTGRSVGMPSNPTPAQQDAAADAIYARGGRGQWPVCGRYLR